MRGLEALQIVDADRHLLSRMLAQPIASLLELRLQFGAVEAQVSRQIQRFRGHGRGVRPLQADAQAAAFQLFDARHQGIAARCLRIDFGDDPVRRYAAGLDVVQHIAVQQGEPTCETVEEAVLAAAREERSDRGVLATVGNGLLEPDAVAQDLLSLIDDRRASEDRGFSHGCLSREKLGLSGQLEQMGARFLHGLGEQLLHVQTRGRRTHRPTTWHRRCPWV